MSEEDDTTAVTSKQYQAAKLFATAYLASMDHPPLPVGETSPGSEQETSPRNNGVHLQTLTMRARAKAKKVGKEIYALIEMAEMHYKNRWTMDCFELLLVTICLAYVAAPMDALPDIIAAIGYVDDVAVVAFMVETLRDNIARFEAWKESNEPEYQSGKEEVCCTAVGCTIL